MQGLPAYRPWAPGTGLGPLWKQQMWSGAAAFQPPQDEEASGSSSSSDSPPQTSSSATKPKAKSAAKAKAKQKAKAKAKTKPKDPRVAGASDSSSSGIKQPCLCHAFWLGQIVYPSEEATFEHVLQGVSGIVDAVEDCVITVLTGSGIQKLPAESLSLKPCF